MRRIIALATMTAALTVPLAATAAADTGGTPNDNASSQTGNGNPMGRKGNCTVVPGSFFKGTAKDDGPNHPLGVPNGQAVKLCTPAGS